MDDKKTRASDRSGSILFLILTLGFVLLMVFNKSFFDWDWERHHKTLSWYIRPIAIFPFIYFAYQKNLTGMMATVFALATSIAWFPEPVSASSQVIEFLSMEHDYLSSNWTVLKFLGTLLVPLYFALVAIAFWKRVSPMGG